MNRLRSKTDNELIKLFLKTNRKRVFGEIYNRHIDSVFFYVLKQTGNKETAEDITSETFFTLLKNLHKFNETSKLQTFIIGIAKNKIKQHWDKLKKQKRSEYIEELPANSTSEIVELIEEDEKNNNREEIVTQIDKILEQLEERDRIVLTERFLRGSSSVDVANKLGISKGNLRIIQFRAIKKARKALEAITGS